MASYHKDYEFLMNKHYCSQAEDIAKAINRISFQEKNNFIFVDVGSHIGKLTNLIIKNLKSKHSSLEIHCIEPDIETFEELKNNINENNVQFYNALFQEWLKDNQLVDRVNLMVNSHTFYHYDKSIWDNIFYLSNELLNNGGKHFVLVDSKNDEILEIKKELDQSIKKTHSVFGKFLIGNDLRKYFISKNIEFELVKVSSPLYFDYDDKTLDKVCHMIGFIMRYDPKDVKRYGKDIIQEYISQYKQNDKVIFPRNQDLFILNKK
jgi:hypothetical protein